ncbi:MAG: ZIP family metal transporter [Gammaproteobacteria bacterium]|nr:ZIP family metal transporter [Gammaproteobacteria bacterium]
MILITYKAIAGLLIFITSIVAVIYPLKSRIHPAHNGVLELGDAFASGIFLGAALFHMIPDANLEFTQILGLTKYPLSEFFCAAGFLLLLFFERLSENTGDHSTGKTISYIFAAIIIIHSLIEGTVLGINTTFATASIIFLAIIAHKGSESFALAITLNQSKLAIRPTLILIAIFSLMTPLGIALGTTLTLFLQYKTGGLLAAGFTAFASGTFLYMSTLHHINHHKRAHEGEGMKEFGALVTGLSVMAVLGIWS